MENNTYYHIAKRENNIILEFSISKKGENTPGWPEASNIKK